MLFVERYIELLIILIEISYIEKNYFIFFFIIKFEKVKYLSRK